MKTNKKQKDARKLLTAEERARKIPVYEGMEYKARKGAKALKVRKIEEVADKRRVAKAK